MLLIFWCPLGMLFCPDLSHCIKHVPILYTSVPDLLVILVVTCSGSVTVLALHTAAVEDVSHNRAVEISELVRRGRQCDMIITILSQSPLGVLGKGPVLSASGLS